MGAEKGAPGDVLVRLLSRLASRRESPVSDKVYGRSGTTLTEKSHIASCHHPRKQTQVPWVDSVSLFGFPSQIASRHIIQ
uniref:Uncharacterized protein n=1 Tax=Panagrellus redivivus TaxID=6233 RepID=A0A7E4ZUL3_PANRE